MTFTINGKAYSIETTVSDYCGVEVLEQLTATLVNQKRFDRLHRLLLEGRQSLPTRKCTWIELDYSIDPIAISNVTITIFGSDDDIIGADDYTECIDVKLSGTEKDMFIKIIEGSITENE